MPKKRAESRKGMVVTTVALNRGLHRRLVLTGLDTNTTLNELIRQALREWLGRKRTPKKT